MYSDGKSDPLTFRVNLSAARSEGEGRWGGRGRARREGSAGPPERERDSRQCVPTCVCFLACFAASFARFSSSLMIRLACFFATSKHPFLNPIAATMSTFTGVSGLVIES